VEAVVCLIIEFMEREKLLAIFLLFAVIASFGCSGKGVSEVRGENTRSASVDSAAVKVTMAKAELREIPAYIQATGSLVAFEVSNVAPKIAGKVVNVYVEVGQFVNAGAVIAKLDDREAKLRLAEAEAAIKQAESAVRQAELRLGLNSESKFSVSEIPEVRQAQANYEQALAELRQAEANELRYRELAQTGDVSAVTYEQYRTALETAKARANAAKQNLEAVINQVKQNNQAIKSAQAAVEVAKANAETARQAVADTVIRAPFAGFVSEKRVAPGEYVTSSNPVITLVRTNPIKVQVQVPESNVPEISLGSKISLKVDAYKDRDFFGVVTAVNPSVDPATRSAVVEAQVENGENLLRPGMFATVRINLKGSKSGIFVPKSAVYNDRVTQSYRVFVVKDDVVRLRVVQLGSEEGDMIQILDGVNADEVVATSNLEQLYEGAPVQIISSVN
jgi:multidrug efflux pump subunit AcrA (membrane-fusion protein)